MLLMNLSNDDELLNHDNPGSKLATTLHGVKPRYLKKFVLDATMKTFGISCDMIGQLHCSMSGLPFLTGRQDILQKLPLGYRRGDQRSVI